MRVFFSETREFRRNVRLVTDVVMEIIGQKRQQLQQNKGLSRFATYGRDKTTLTFAEQRT